MDFRIGSQSFLLSIFNYDEDLVATIYDSNTLVDVYINPYHQITHEDDDTL